MICMLYGGIRGVVYLIPQRRVRIARLLTSVALFLTMATANNSDHKDYSYGFSFR